MISIIFLFVQTVEVNFKIIGLSLEIMLLFSYPHWQSPFYLEIFSPDLLEGSADIVMEGYEASSGSVRRWRRRVKHSSLCNFCYSSLTSPVALALSST